MAKEYIYFSYYISNREKIGKIAEILEGRGICCAWQKFYTSMCSVIIGRKNVSLKNAVKNCAFVVSFPKFGESQTDRDDQWRERHMSLIEHDERLIVEYDKDVFFASKFFFYEDDPDITTIADGIEEEYRRRVPETAAENTGLTEKFAFISHKSKDYVRASGIRDILEENGIRCCIAPDDMKSGDYSDTLVERVENCGCFILVLTNVTQSSKAVKSEVELAFSAGKPIVIADLEKVPIEGGFRFYLNTAHRTYVSSVSPECEGMKNIINDVKNFLGR